MKRISVQKRLAGLAIAMVCWAAIVIVGSQLSGCSDAQKQAASADLNGAAVNASKIATLTSSTQPAVAVIEAAVPSSTPYITAANTITALIALALGAAGAAVVKNVTIANLQSAVPEIVADVEAWKNPGVSFTSKTEKIVSDLAGIVAAAPVQPTGGMPVLQANVTAPSPAASAVGKTI